MTIFRKHYILICRLYDIVIFRLQKVFDLIQRAVTWLETNQYDTKILKWNTGAWGEIPADYGRK